MTRAVLLVLDSLGIGASADAGKFGDCGANTLLHIAEQCALGRAETGRHGRLTIPNLTRMGLVHACIDSCGCLLPVATSDIRPDALYGYAAEQSTGKDSPSGHWEIAGVPVTFEWGYFQAKQQSFPTELLAELAQRAGVEGFLGNCHASGTEILKQLGELHLQTGQPIVYTSVDSVFQIAAHEQVFGLDRLYRLCECARQLLDPLNVGRVIARPFIGTDATSFTRTANRRDYAVPPPAPTLLERLVQAGHPVTAIGKIADLYAHRGITQSLKASGIDGLFDATIKAFKQADNGELVMVNFVDFDSEYGHRRDVAGYACALEQFDRRLPELWALMAPDDLLIITADHGCDPTWPGTDHTREHIPILVYGQQVRPQAMGMRHTFADIGQSLAHYFGLPALPYGSNFLPEN